MSRVLNSRVVGASLVGIALVVGAFAVSRTNNFTDSQGNTSALYVADAPAPARTAIGTLDTNTDGVEDWKEPFLTAQPVILNDTKPTFERENTLTAQLGINVVESMLLSKSFGSAGTPNETLVSEAADRARQATADTPYTVADVITITASPEVVRNYGNAAANIITTNDVKDLPNELLILEKALETGNQEELDQIKVIADMYAKNRDDLLNLPVPSPLTEAHLGLINVFNSIANDLTAMAAVNTDPVLSLVRLQRYQNDATELARALRSMHVALSAHSTEFSVNDPALLFSAFSQVQ